MTNEMPTCFFLLKAFLLNSGITFCSNLSVASLGIQNCIPISFPDDDWAAFPIWQIGHGKRMAKPSWYHALVIPPVAYLVFVYVYLYLQYIYIYMLFSYIVDSIWTFIPCQRRFLADNRYPICNDPIYGKACVSNRQVRRSWSHVFWIVGSVDSPCGHSQVSLDEFVKMMYRWPPVLVVQRFFFMDLFVMCQIVVTGCCENMWDVIRTCMFWSNGIYQEREEFECLLV